MYLEEQVIILSNGKRVANFSSPHPFTFEDGSILPAHTTEWANVHDVEFHEIPVEGGMEGDVTLQFKLPIATGMLMVDWATMHKEGKVDVVFCCLPMIEAMKVSMYWDTALLDSPFRAIRMVDRTSKKISIWKQSL